MWVMKPETGDLDSYRTWQHEGLTILQPLCSEACEVGERQLRGNHLRLEQKCPLTPTSGILSWVEFNMRKSLD